MFKKILFATTGTSSCDAAARVAFDLAKRYDAALYALHVFGVPDRSFSRTATDIRTGKVVDLHDDAVQAATKELKETYAYHIDNYKAPSFSVLAGIPHTEILRTARKEDVDLIVMGARTAPEDNGGTAHRNIAGRTLQGVARAARCPVLVIGRPAASFWGGISNIVFGTDFSKAADSAFRFAVKLAETFDCKLRIFHAIDIRPDAFSLTRPQETIEDGIRDARETIRKQYVPSLTGVGDYDIDVWEGVPHVEIVKYAREYFADLIVMAHHTAKADQKDAVLGSTMEQVVLRSNCPVISVNHPDKV